MRKTSWLKRFTNSHGNGVFIIMDPSHYPLFSEVLQTALTCDKPVNIRIFKDMETLPESARIMVNWFLMSRKDAAIHQKVAKNFVKLMGELDQLIMETFLHVSSTLMKRPIKAQEGRL